MKRFMGSMLVSGLVHLALYGAAMGLILWEQAHAQFRMEVDQSNVPLLALSTHLPPPPEPWIIANKVKSKLPQLTQPTPTPEPAESAYVGSQPSWIGGFITEDDYPDEMRRQNKEGVVIVDLLIDTGGNVEAVSIVHGSEPQFNKEVMEKMKYAKFKPALDQSGQPMGCRIRMPISFRLK